MPDKTNFFEEDEIDALQEIMNIAFGQAAAELAEVIDISVDLSFPKMGMVSVDKLPEYINENIQSLEKCNMVEQSYKGSARGVAYLIFPHGTEKDFISLFHMEEVGTNELFVDVEREVISEVGNILIGACVSKIFDLLKSTVIYAPPHTIIGSTFQRQFICERFKEGDYAIMLNTTFSLSEKTIEGYLFLINCQTSITPLKKALQELFESYE